MGLRPMAQKFSSWYSILYTVYYLWLTPPLHWHHYLEESPLFIFGPGLFDSMIVHRVSIKDIYRPRSKGDNVLQVQLVVSIHQSVGLSPLSPLSRLNHCQSNRGGSLPEILNYLPDRGQFSWVPVLIQIQVKFLFQIHEVIFEYLTYPGT